MSILYINCSINKSWCQGEQKHIQTLTLLKRGPVKKQSKSLCDVFSAFASDVQVTSLQGSKWEFQLSNLTSAELLVASAMCCYNSHIFNFMQKKLNNLKFHFWSSNLESLAYLTKVGWSKRYLIKPMNSSPSKEHASCSLLRLRLRVASPSTPNLAIVERNCKKFFRCL